MPGASLLPLVGDVTRDDRRALAVAHRDRQPIFAAPQPLVNLGGRELDQRHRAVLTFIYHLPLNVSAGTVTQLASARPFNATTGIDNNGDGANNDRPVVNGKVISKSNLESFLSRTGLRVPPLTPDSREALAALAVVLRNDPHALQVEGHVIVGLGIVDHDAAREAE